MQDNFSVTIRFDFSLKFNGKSLIISAIRNSKHETSSRLNSINFIGKPGGRAVEVSSYTTRIGTDTKSIQVNIGSEL